MRYVYAAVAAFVIVYVALDFNKLYALRYGADLGTYLQTLINLQHGSSWNFGEWKPHLQVHDSAILLLLVPLAALFPYAQTLIVVQVLLVAVAALPLVAFSRELGLDARKANLIGIAYLLSPAAQGAVYDNFSENVFVPLLAFAGALFARRRQVAPTLIVAVLLAITKEDELLFLLWFGIACALWWDRRIGVGTIAISLIAGLAFLAVEHAGGAHPNVPGYSAIVYAPASKIAMVVLLLLPFAFAPVMSGRALLLGLPLLAEIVFMRPWNYEPSRVGSHYTVPLLAVTAIAAAAGLRRAPRMSAAILPCAIVATLLFNDTGLHIGRWPYIVDWPAYARARAIRDSHATVTISRGDEGVWAVAAANPEVRLDPHPDLRAEKCPAYDTDFGAFAGSFAGRMLTRLCGGVPLH
jgi:uncharacterized membrane protein